MNKRGKVLRDTSAGSGLLFVDGQQYPFTLEGLWKSEVPPTVGMVVDVVFSAANQITEVRAVPDADLAKEELQRLAEKSKQKAKVALAVSQQLAMPMVSRLKQELMPSALVARFGMPTLIAIGALAAGWLFFDWISIRVSARNEIHLTFWNIIGFVQSLPEIIRMFATDGITGTPPRPTTNYYSWFAIVALLAPLAQYFWKNPRAYLGNFIPLLFMVAIFAKLGLEIHDGIEQLRTMAGAMNGLFGFSGPVSHNADQEMAKMADEFLSSAIKAVSFGLGIVLSFGASLYFTGKGAVKYLASKA